MTPLRVFIGWDAREPVAYHVAAHSILRRASRPVSITALVLGQLGVQRDANASTEFSRTRFLVPSLCGYEGLAVYLDCDMLCLTDLCELEPIARGGSEAVWVCPHDYTPKTVTKMDGQVQSLYPRKNWSSLMVFNNAACRALTPEYVRQASGLELHRLQWVSDAQIGRLPLSWNHLVGEYPYNPDARMLHYTCGGPWFPEYRNCDHAPEWLAEREAMLGC